MMINIIEFIECLLNLFLYFINVFELIKEFIYWVFGGIDILKEWIDFDVFFVKVKVIVLCFFEKDW